MSTIERRRYHGEYVTRAELHEYQQRIDEKLTTILDDVRAIKERIGAPGRWLRQRATNLVDGALGKTGAALAGGSLVAALFHFHIL